MQILKKRLIYFVWAVLIAYSYFTISSVIFYEIANENILIAKVWNIAILILILGMEKVEIHMFNRYKAKTKDKEPTAFSKMMNLISKGGSFKTGLYLFYIVLLICSAIASVEPDLLDLGSYSAYFQSTEYGILILIAADAFLGQLFRDIAEDDLK